ncbi:TPA: ESPR domain-containing protein, partial [Burkholderia contaminans]
MPSTRAAHRTNTGRKPCRRDERHVNVCRTRPAGEYRQGFDYNKGKTKVNKTYALVWNVRQGAWQVAGERVRRRGKSTTRAGVVVVLAWLAGSAAMPVHALPAGEK